MTRRRKRRPVDPVLRNLRAIACGVRRCRLAEKNCAILAAGQQGLGFTTRDLFDAYLVGRIAGYVPMRVMQAAVAEARRHFAAEVKP